VLLRSHIARHQLTWDSHCWLIYPPMTLAIFPLSNSSNALRMRSLQWKHWSATGATSITGTNTQTLKPLLPAYISTVDSGNLAAHLLTLRAGLLELPAKKILGAQLFNGLNDTLRILVDSADGFFPERSANPENGSTTERPRISMQFHSGYSHGMRGNAWTSWPHPPLR